MEEHRQYIRLNKSLIVSYRIVNQLLGSGSRTKDISAGGICLPLFQRLKPGMILELEIFFTEYNKPIRATGKIIWLRERSDVEFPFETGIQFIKIADIDRDKIFDYISKEDLTRMKWLNEP